MIFLSVYYKHKQGGYNQRLYELYRALAQRRHCVHYIATEVLPVHDTNIKPHILRAPFQAEANLIFWCYFCAVAPFYCLWIAWRHRVEKIVVFASFYAFISSLPVVLLRKKMVTFLRIDVISESVFEKRPWYKKAVYRFFEQVGLRLSCLVVPNSRSLMRAVARRHKNINFAVLPNSIEHQFHLPDDAKASVRAEYRLEERNFIVVTASRLAPVKNIGFLIEAFSLVQSPQVRLVIVGEDSDGSGEGQRLKHLARQLGENRRIVFTGWIDRPQRLIAACDLFVLPTLHEGSPNALLEALSCRVPCLGSDIPEISEILEFDDLLFPLDNPGELARKIGRTATDADAYKRVQERCMQIARKYVFDWQDRVSRLVAGESVPKKNDPRD